MDNKRQLILNSALQLFTERGFHGAPTSLIAKNAGVANGTLFHYFKSKEVLINDLYLDIKSDMHENVAVGIPEDSSFRDKFKTIWIQATTWTMNNQLKFAFIQAFNTSPFITRLTKKAAIKNWDSMAELFDSGIKKGILKNFDHDLIGGIIGGILVSFSAYLIENPEKINDKDFVESAFEAAWDAIRK